MPSQALRSNFRIAQCIDLDDKLTTKPVIFMSLSIPVCSQSGPLYNLVIVLSPRAFLGPGGLKNKRKTFRAVSGSRITFKFT